LILDERLELTDIGHVTHMLEPVPSTGEGMAE
jgi:hypothetical protein